MATDGGPARPKIYIPQKAFKQVAEALEKITTEMADSIILKYNGEKTIQKICVIIKIHIKHVKTYFYLVFYSKIANNILVYTATNDFLCMLEPGLVANSQSVKHK